MSSGENNEETHGPESASMPDGQSKEAQDVGSFIQGCRFARHVVPKNVNVVDRDAYSGWGAIVVVMYVLHAVLW
jgi:hypothetical protein